MSEENLWYGTLAATVRVDDLPASRRVVAIELPDDGQWRVCGYGVSDGNGIAQLDITGLPTSRIYAVAIDDWGKPFEPNLAVATGDVIRPTQFVGWMYQVTSPGVLPGTEPAWWNAMADIPQPVGTAMMKAVRHYRPMAHGPVSDIEWVEQEFDPHWDYVVTLLHLDGNLVCEKGRAWSAASLGFDDGMFGQGAITSAVSDIRSDDLANVHFDVDDYTIEFFMKPAESMSTYGSLVAKRDAVNGQGEFFIDRNGDRIRFGTSSGSTWFEKTGTIVTAADIWTHAAVVRQGAEMRSYVNGQLDATIPIPLVLSFSSSARNSRIRVGSLSPGQGLVFNGVVDELRITKGVARYTENFTAPTAPFPNVGPPL